MIPALADSLAQWEPFRLLPQEALAELAAGAKLIRFQPGQVLFTPGEIPAQIGVVIEGKVRLLALPEAGAAPFTLATGGAGTICGWLSIANQAPLETVMASSVVVCAQLEPAVFSGLALRFPEFGQALRQASGAPEVYDLLTRRLGAAKGRETLQALAAEGFREVRIVMDAFPDSQEGLSWFVSCGNGLLSRGESWPNGSAPASARGLRFIGLPASLFRDVPAAPAPPAAEPSLLDLAEHHQRQYPEIRGEAGAEAVCACFAMLAEFFKRPAKTDVLRRLLKGKDAGDFFTVGTLVEIAGLRAQLIRLQRDKLAAVEAPAILPWKGQPAVLFATDGHECVLSSPIEGLVRLPRESWEQHFADEIEMLLIRQPEEEREKFDLRWFLPAIKKHKRVLIEVLVASFFVQLFALANPLITQVIIDKVLVQNSLPTLNVVGALLIIVAISGAVTTALRTYLFVDTTNRIDLALGTKIIDHLYRLTLGYFHRRPVGEVTSRINELENIRQFLTGTALTVVLDGVFSVIYILIMLFYNVALTFVALSALPLLGIMTYVIAPIFREQLRRRARHNAAAQSYLVETLTGVQTVKAQNLEQRARWEWQERYARFVSEGFRTSMTTTTVNSVTSLLSKMSDLAVLWAGAYLVINNKLSLGQLIAFRIIAGYVTSPLLRLIQSWQNFQEVGLSIERLGDIMASPAEQNEEQSRNIPLPSIQGEVRYEEITFSYIKAHAPQLRNVSFSVPEGAFVGIVGQSGSGKSTLMKLLPRLYLPDSGRVLVDGYDIAKVEMYSLRRQIATVLQDSLLFDITVQQNIAVGDPHASADEIIAAARVAGAHDFIMGLQDGYNTRVGEQGRALSGGQRQRIAIARAVLQKPRLLILDEATSALDFPTERLVCSNLIENFRGRTVFFVTHRLRSIEQADVILVMEQGVLAETGAHAELLAKRGIYYSLYQQQATA